MSLLTGLRSVADAQHEESCSTCQRVSQTKREDRREENRQKGRGKRVKERVRRSKSRRNYFP